MPSSFILGNYNEDLWFFVLPFVVVVVGGFCGLFFQRTTKPSIKAIECHGEARYLRSESQNEGIFLAHTTSFFYSSNNCTFKFQPFISHVNEIQMFTACLPLKGQLSHTELISASCCLCWQLLSSIFSLPVFPKTVTPNHLLHFVCLQSFPASNTVLIDSRNTFFRDRGDSYKQSCRCGANLPQRMTENKQLHLQPCTCLATCLSCLGKTIHSTYVTWAY